MLGSTGLSKWADKPKGNIKCLVWHGQQRMPAFQENCAPLSWVFCWLDKAELCVVVAANTRTATSDWAAICQRDVTCLSEHRDTS